MKNAIRSLIVMLFLFDCCFGGMAYAQWQQNVCNGANATSASCQSFVSWQTQQALIANDQLAIDQDQAKLKNDEDSYKVNQAQSVLLNAQTTLTTLQGAITASPSNSQSQQSNQVNGS